MYMLHTHIKIHIRIMINYELHFLGIQTQTWKIMKLKVNLEYEPFKNLVNQCLLRNG